MAARATTPCPATAARTRWSAARATTRSTLATASASSSSAAAAGTRSRPTRRTGSPAARRSCAEELAQPEAERPQPRAVAGGIDQAKHRSHVAKLIDLVDVPDVFDVVRLAARLGLEPCVENLLEQRLARPPQRQRQDVRVVPLPGAAGRFRVVPESGSPPGPLVGRDRGAGARPAAHDALLCAPARDIARGRLAGPSPVVPLAVGESAMRQHFVPARAQCIEHRLGHSGPLVGCDSNLQRAGKRTLCPAATNGAGVFFDYLGFDALGRGKGTNYAPTRTDCLPGCPDDSRSGFNSSRSPRRRHR